MPNKYPQNSCQLLNVVCEWPTTTQKNPYFVHQTWKYNLRKKKTKFWHVKRSIEIFKLKIMLEISKCFMMRLVLVFFLSFFPNKTNKKFHFDQLLPRDRGIFRLDIVIFSLSRYFDSWVRFWAFNKGCVHLN